MWRGRLPDISPSMRATLCVLAFGLFGFGMPAKALARSETDCASAWSRAVRSYLTQNRRAAPDGTVPEDLDGEELAAQAWVDAFRPACRLEAAGDGRGARVAAAAAGVAILVRLDPNGCTRFLSAYMGSSEPQALCSMATEAPRSELEKALSPTLPAR